jgi:hypothetical protein
LGTLRNTGAVSTVGLEETVASNGDAVGKLASPPTPEVTGWMPSWVVTDADGPVPTSHVLLRPRPTIVFTGMLGIGSLMLRYIHGHMKYRLDK